MARWTGTIIATAARTRAREGILCELTSRNSISRFQFRFRRASRTSLYALERKTLDIVYDVSLDDLEFYESSDDVGAIDCLTSAVVDQNSRFPQDISAKP